MRSFFLAIGAENIRNFENRGIPAYQFDIHGQKGVIVQETDLAEVLSILGSRSVNTYETPYDGIHGVTLERGDAQPNIETGRSRRKPATSVSPVGSVLEQYLSEVTKPLDMEIARVEAAFNSESREVTAFQEQLTQLIRNINTNRVRLEGLRSRSMSALEQLGKEFDKLREVRGVKDIEIADTTVKVFTNMLYCRNPATKKLHEIGEFRIELYGEQNQSAGCVKWFNLTRTVDGGSGKMNAPHVRLDGNACLGNTSTTFPQLISNYEFSAAAMLAIQFIESVNINDQWGRYIVNWPIASEETVSAKTSSRGQSGAVATPGFSISSDRWVGGNYQGFASVASRILPKLCQDIVLTAAGGEVSPLSKSEVFKVHIWATPRERSWDSIVQIPERMWRLRVDTNAHAFKPGTVGRKITTPEGFIVAELVDKNNLYILYDLTRHGTENEYKIFGHILEAALDLCLEDIPYSDRIKKGTEALASKKAAARKAYIELCSKRLKSSTVEIEKTLADDEAKGLRLQSAYTSKLQAAIQNAQLLELLKPLREPLVKKAETRFIELQNLAEVDGLELRGRELCVSTKALPVGPGEAAALGSLGKYELLISLDGNDGCIKWSKVQSGSRKTKPKNFADWASRLNADHAVLPSLVANWEISKVTELALKLIKAMALEQAPKKEDAKQE